MDTKCLQYSRIITDNRSLSDKRFGLKKGRQTVNAKKEVQKIASFLSITPKDLRCNNSRRQECICGKKNGRGEALPIEGLIGMVACDLSDREIKFEAKGTSKTVEISSGTPQEAILGPAESISSIDFADVGRYGGNSQIRRDPGELGKRDPSTDDKLDAKK
ncbi:hypothetical protein JTB14_001528 [Gonioctena quinquepunctata]|nr:hypothetical protein JTB14_001528 [Gonioctena quinquepunctata]